MKKQTAIEWLVEQILDDQGDLITNAFKYGVDLTGFVNQAKAMEKEQLYSFYMQGGVDAIMESDRNVEEYYNETFKP